MKKIIKYILILIAFQLYGLFNIGQLNAYYKINDITYDYIGNITKTEKEIKLEKKIDPIIDNIIENKKNELGIYGGYKSLYEFNKKLRKLSEVKNRKLQLLSKMIEDKIRQYEQKYFIDTKTKTIYVEDFNSLYVYFNGYKFSVYTTDDKTETYTYKLCEINKKDHCVKYDKVLFQSSIPLSEIPQLKKEKPFLEINENEIYQNSVIGYFDQVNNFIEFDKGENFQKTLLDYNNLDLKYGKNYTPISNLAIVNLNGKKVLGIYEKNKIADVNLSKYKNINKSAIIEAIYEDSKFLGRTITQKDLDILYKQAKDLKDITTIYNYIKNNVSYNKDVYNQYIETKKVNPKLNYVFTGIGSAENKNAVCSGYTSYLEYLLGFLNYKDIEQQSGFYIDQYSGNLIPHSWLKVGTKYYDITFDDGINSRINKYYALPQELIMLDRVLFSDTNEYNKIIKMGRDERFKYLYRNYFKYSKIDKFKNYRIIAPYVILSKYNINENNFTLNKLWNNIPEKYKIKFDGEGKLIYLKDYFTDNDVKITNISLVEVKNTEILINALEQYKLKNIIMAIDENNKFFVLLKIVK